MSSKRPPRSKQARTPAVLVFGESPTDTASIRTLTAWLRPDLERAIKPMRDPVSLTRQAKELPVRNWMAEIERVTVAQARGGQPVAAVLIHQDADAVDVDGSEQTRLQAELQQHLTTTPHAVVPVVTIESWWLHFPTATESINPIAWRDKLSRQNRETDRIVAPKQELLNATKRPGPEYREIDGPRIATAIATGGHTPVGSSSSFERFRSAVDSLPGQ